MNLPSSPLDRQHPSVDLADAPVLFAGAGLRHPLVVCWWGGVLAWGWPVPAVAGGAIVWHAHELVLGLAVAAVAGFALTALPEFTGVACGTCRQLRVLVGLWLLVRLGFWASGALGLPALVLAGASQLALLLGVAWVLLPGLQDRYRAAALGVCLAATGPGRDQRRVLQRCPARPAGPALAGCHGGGADAADRGGGQPYLHAHCEQRD